MFNFAPCSALWQRDAVSLPRTSSSVSSGFKSYPLVFKTPCPLSALF